MRAGSITIYRQICVDTTQRAQRPAALQLSPAVMFQTKRYDCREPASSPRTRSVHWHLQEQLAYHRAVGQLLVFHLDQRPTQIRIETLDLRCNPVGVGTKILLEHRSVLV